MKNALAQIALQVEKVLETDEFPSSISPNFLKLATSDYPNRGGKRLRPALLIWSSQLLGGSFEQALYPACAVEVFHNWTLVHDDIIDQDSFRRNVPTCHKQLEKVGEQEFNLNQNQQERFGREFAILTGDLQQGWANSLLLRANRFGASAELILAINLRLQEFVNRMLIVGEALDVEFSYRSIESITPAEVERMYELKTGVLLQFCAETGAMLATNDVTRSNPYTIALGEMAMAAAVAFQIKDDYLGIFGDATFGKPIGGDLSCSKATLLLLHAMGNLPTTSRNELTNLLGKTHYSNEELAKARQLFVDSGAVKSVCQRMDELTNIAQSRLETLPINIYKEYIQEFINFLCVRDV